LDRVRGLDDHAVIVGPPRGYNLNTKI
jgi:hypothetical protein